MSRCCKCLQRYHLLSDSLTDVSLASLSLRTRTRGILQLVSGNNTLLNLADLSRSTCFPRITSECGHLLPVDRDWTLIDQAVKGIGRCFLANLPWLSRWTCVFESPLLFNSTCIIDRLVLLLEIREVHSEEERIRSFRCKFDDDHSRGCFKASFPKPRLPSARGFNSSRASSARPWNTSTDASRNRDP